MYISLRVRREAIIRLACIILIFLALVITGVALADEAADEELVNNGTNDLVTIIEGTLYTASQSVSGTGFANINSNLAVVDPEDNSRVLHLKNVGSGSGYYSHNSLITVVNNTDLNPNGEFETSNHTIRAEEDTSAVYAPITYHFPGSFGVKTVKSLWKDRTYTKNYAGQISMDSIFDNARSLNTKSTTTLYSVEHKYSELFEPDIAVDAESSMDINSKFNGSAHLGVTTTDVRGGNEGVSQTKADSPVLMDEDYKGSFDITKKMAVSVKKTIDYGDLDTDISPYDYPWLPCVCNLGWDDMTVHDTRYHSAKGFFDCMTCLPPAPCKN